jgi:hypothetical protein
MAHKHMKKNSATLAIKEMQVKMTLRFHQIGYYQEKTTVKAGKDVGGWVGNPYTLLVGT